MASKTSPVAVTGVTTTDHPVPRRALVDPRVDAWLVGGLGIVAWLLFATSTLGFPEIPAVASGPIYWLLLALSGTHFGASYHLAYGQGRAHVRQHAGLLILVPALLVAASVAVLAMALSSNVPAARSTLGFLLALVYSSTSWHYVKQVYGVARVGASLQNVRLDSTTVNALRYGLYPVFGLEAVKLWSGRRVFNVHGLRVGYDLLPRSLAPVLSWLTYLALAVVMLTFVRLIRDQGRLPATVWAPYVAAYLWFLFPPSYASVVLVFGALHGLQYLACAHRAEVAWGLERSPGRPNLWWSSAFGGALATGMLLVFWLPQLLDTTTEATVLGTMPAALLFVGFNLHHYAVDASIWRFGGHHIRRMLGR